MPEFLDLSNVNGPVDFAKVRQARIAGVWLKATEGATYVDKLFAVHRRRANAAGLRVGAYHFARPDHNTPLEDARNFCAIVKKIERRDLRPVLDLEVSTSLHPRELEAWARKWNQHVLDRLGRIPMFYSYPWYIEKMDMAKPIGNGLWLASYGRNDGGNHPVTAPKPWKAVACHQYTSNGTCPGVSGHVDRSYAIRLTQVLAYPVVGLL